MAREADRLVDAIRAQRGRLTGNLSEILSVTEIERRVKKAPLTWLLGGSVAGLLAVRFVLPPLVAHGRGVARSWVRERLRNLVLALVLASTTRESRQTTAPPAPPESARRGEGELASAGNGARVRD